jgi:hypothetical protein
MRTRTLDDNTQASDPGGIRISREKLQLISPELCEPRGLWKLFGGFSPRQQFWQLGLAEHMMHGDSRAAIVVERAPLLVAAYTDELDCVALLSFPQWLAERYALTAGGRLLTVNLYEDGTSPVSDLWNGPASFRR